MSVSVSVCQRLSMSVSVCVCLRAAPRRLSHRGACLCLYASVCLSASHRGVGLAGGKDDQQVRVQAHELVNLPGPDPARRRDTGQMSSPDTGK
jgi:hypothetical protein